MGGLSSIGARLFGRGTRGGGRKGLGGAAMARKKRSNARKLSRREFLARSAAAGVAHSMPAALASSASIGAAAAADPELGSIPLQGWRMRQFVAGDSGLLLSAPNQPLGKILRLTLDGKPAPGNPMAGKIGAATVPVINPPADMATSLI
jgi:hypothetical protein